jgi:hypothetical protein
MRPIGVLTRQGLILGSLSGNENMFCTYQVFYPTHLAVMAVIFTYAFQGRLLTSIQNCIIYYSFSDGSC